MILNFLLNTQMIWRKKTNYLSFMKQSYFDVPKNDRPNSTHYFVMKIPDKQELQ